MSVSGWNKLGKLLGWDFEEGTRFHQLKIYKRRPFHTEKMIIAKCGDSESMTYTGHGEYSSLTRKF